MLDASITASRIPASMQMRCPPWEAGTLYAQRRTVLTPAHSELLGLESRAVDRLHVHT